jgi:Ca2+-binding EF-hand superfamily protein
MNVKNNVDMKGLQSLELDKQERDRKFDELYDKQVERSKNQEEKKKLQQIKTSPTSLNRLPNQFQLGQKNLNPIQLNDKLFLQSPVQSPNSSSNSSPQLIPHTRPNTPQLSPPTRPSNLSPSQPLSSPPQLFSSPTQHLSTISSQHIASPPTNSPLTKEGEPVVKRVSPVNRHRYHRNIVNMNSFEKEKHVEHTETIEDRLQESKAKALGIKIHELIPNNKSDDVKIEISSKELELLAKVKESQIKAKSTKQISLSERLQESKAKALGIKIHELIPYNKSDDVKIEISSKELELLAKVKESQIKAKSTKQISLSERLQESKAKALGFKIHELIPYNKSDDVKIELSSKELELLAKVKESQIKAKSTKRISLSERLQESKSKALGIKIHELIPYNKSNIDINVSPVHAHLLVKVKESQLRAREIRILDEKKTKVDNKTFEDKLLPSKDNDELDAKLNPLINPDDSVKEVIHQEEKIILINSIQRYSQIVQNLRNSLLGNIVNDTVTPSRTARLINNKNIDKSKSTAVKKAFALLDSDGNGNLSTIELKRWLENPVLNLFNCTDDSVRFVSYLIDQIDVNGDKCISIDELSHFLFPTLQNHSNSGNGDYLESGIMIEIARNFFLKQILKSTSNNEDSIELLKCFATLTKANLKRGSVLYTRTVKKAFIYGGIIISEINRPLTDDESQQLVNHIDANNDGVISAKEFKDWLFKKSGNLLAVDLLPFKNIIDENYGGNVAEMFNHMDKLNNKSLYKADFIKSIQEIDHTITRDKATSMLLLLLSGSVVTLESILDSFENHNIHIESKNKIAINDNIKKQFYSRIIDIEKNLSREKSELLLIQIVSDIDHRGAEIDKIMDLYYYQDQINYDEIKLKQNYASPISNKLSVNSPFFNPNKAPTSPLSKSTNNILFQPIVRNIIEDSIEVEYKVYNDDSIIPWKPALNFINNSPSKEKNMKIVNELSLSMSSPSSLKNNYYYSPSKSPSKSLHLGGGAVGLNEQQLVNCGYRLHIGRWRGFPYDSWSCCNGTDKICKKVATNEIKKSQSIKIVYFDQENAINSSISDSSLMISKKPIFSIIKEKTEKNSINKEVEIERKVVSKKIVSRPLSEKKVVNIPAGKKDNVPIEKKVVPKKIVNVPIEKKVVPKKIVNVPIEKKVVPKKIVNVPIEKKVIPKKIVNVPIEKNVIPKKIVNVPIEKKDIPKKIVNVPIEKKVIPKKIVKVPIEKKVIPKKIVNVPIEKKDIPKKIVNVPIEKKVIPKKIVNVPIEKKDIPKKIVNVPIEKKDIPKKIVNVPIEKKDIPKKIVNAPPVDRNVSYSPSEMKVRYIPAEKKVSISVKKNSSNNSYLLTPPLEPKSTILLNNNGNKSLIKTNKNNKIIANTPLIESRNNSIKIEENINYSNSNCNNIVSFKVKENSIISDIKDNNNSTLIKKVNINSSKEDFIINNDKEIHNQDISTDISTELDVNIINSDIDIECNIDDQDIFTNDFNKDIINTLPISDLHQTADKDETENVDKWYEKILKMKEIAEKRSYDEYLEKFNL